MITYVTFIDSPFFAYGTEFFKDGYTSKDQARKEVEAYIEDKYTLEQRVSYKQYSY